MSLKLRNTITRRQQHRRQEKAKDTLRAGSVLTVASASLLRAAFLVASNVTLKQWQLDLGGNGLLDHLVKLELPQMLQR